MDRSYFINSVHLTCACHQGLLKFNAGPRIIEKRHQTEIINHFLVNFNAQDKTGHEKEIYTRK